MIMKVLKILAVSFFALVAIIVILAAVNHIYPTSMGLHDAYYQEDEYALGGYDVVGYFTKGEPIKGNPIYKFEYEEATWIFSEERHLDLFKNNPAAYLPKYGGHCAFAVSQGFAAPGDGAYFNIVDDQLFIFSNPEVQADGMADVENLSISADQNWSK